MLVGYLAVVGSTGRGTAVQAPGPTLLVWRVRERPACFVPVRVRGASAGARKRLAPMAIGGDHPPSVAPRSHETADPEKCEVGSRPGCGSNRRTGNRPDRSRRCRRWSASSGDGQAPDLGCLLSSPKWGHYPSGMPRPGGCFDAGSEPRWRTTCFARMAPTRESAPVDSRSARWKCKPLHG